MFKKEKTMGEKLINFARKCPFLMNIATCILIVVSLSTTGWFIENDVHYGLFQKCWITESDRRQCKSINGRLAEKIASIALLVSLVIHFVSSVVTFLGNIEGNKKYFKIAGGLNLVAVAIISGGSGTYAAMTGLTYVGNNISYSFYVAMAAIASSLTSSTIAFAVVDRVDKPIKATSHESLTEVTVVT